MFENLLGNDSQKSSVDVLDSLLNTENIDMKTDLDLGKIKVLCQLKWFSLLKNPFNKTKTAMDLLDETLEYYKVLMCSLDKNRVNDIIKGISDMKQQFIEEMRLKEMLQNKPQQK